MAKKISLPEKNSRFIEVYTDIVFALGFWSHDGTHELENIPREKLRKVVNEHTVLFFEQYGLPEDCPDYKNKVREFTDQIVLAELEKIK